MRRLMFKLRPKSLFLFLYDDDSAMLNEEDGGGVCKEEAVEVVEVLAEKEGAVPIL